MAELRAFFVNSSKIPDEPLEVVFALHCTVPCTSIMVVTGPHRFPFMAETLARQIPISFLEKLPNNLTRLFQGAALSNLSFTGERALSSFLWSSMAQRYIWPSRYELRCRRTNPVGHSVRPNVDFDLLVSAEAELVLAEGSHFTFVRKSEFL